jgi:hypothetical protein
MQAFLAVPVVVERGRSPFRLRLIRRTQGDTRTLHRLVWLFLVIGAVGCSGGGVDGRESPGAKHEWSILQVAERNARGTPVSIPEFQTIEGYELMAVPSLASGQRIWVMLRPQSPPYYKQTPGGNYAVSKELVFTLAQSGRITSTVEEVLRSHVLQE